MRTYAGMYLIAMSVLVFELTVARLMSVITWYHLSFFAISIAMLGMTAGAVTVFIREQYFSGPDLLDKLSRWSFAYALSLPLALLTICFALLGPQYLTPGLRTVINMGIVAVATAIPFYISGTVISALLSRTELRVTRLYAVDLLGAASGCLVVLLALNFLDAPSVALCAAVLAIAGAFCLQTRRALLRCGVLVSLGLAFVLISNSLNLITPQVVKGHRGITNAAVDEWNSFSRIMVSQQLTMKPAIWAGDLTPLGDKKIRQHYMNIDGAAGSVLQQFNQPEDIEHLRYDVTNVAYFLRPEGGAAIIGVGGGKDVQAAVLFGHQRVLGVELNPIFVDLLQGQFLTFAGIGDHPNVELVVDEARSYLSHSTEQFAILQMSLIDTWAATGAGAFSLSENGLYTREAWQTFLQALQPNGIFTVSRWYSPDNLGETGRALSLAVATLLEEGVNEPSQHIALVAHGKVATLLLSRAPFTQTDLVVLERTLASYNHELLLAPGKPSGDSMLDRIVNATSAQQLQAITAGARLNIAPPTDLNPYFFNMLKLQHLASAMRELGAGEGVVSGNITATITLIYLIAMLCILATVFILFPLWLHRRRYATREPLQPAFLLFFCLIGAAFMALEIALLQRLSVFLGHPIYALGILLFGIIASTGVGSWLSETLDISRRPRALLLALATAAMILLLHALMAPVIGVMMHEAIGWRIAVSLAMIVPMGLLLGCYFPTGMAAARLHNTLAAPWYWGLNGIFGVLFSALAVLISIYLSISVNFYLAAALYLATAGCFWFMLRTPAAVEQNPEPGSV